MFYLNEVLAGAQGALAACVPTACHVIFLNLKDR